MTQQKQMGCPVSGPILQEKALFFRKEFEEGDEKFTASVGWFDKWKKDMVSVFMICLERSYLWILKLLYNVSGKMKT